MAVLKKTKLSLDYAPRSLKILAGLGSDGRHENNVVRDLKKALGDPQIPAPVSKKVPMKVLKPRAGAEPIQMTSYPINCPHIWFSYLYHHCIL